MQASALSIMLPAAVACLALVAILAYLGLHVIKRKVIFVDLALAQIAALGTTVGFLFGIDPTSRAAFVFSLGFTTLGAAIFALSRHRGERVPQEAVIGLVYAVTAAIAILMVDKSPHGAEHIKDLLTGTILWVKWPDIAAATAAFAVAGIAHYLFRRRFILITESPDQAFDQGVRVRLWDFVFYLIFGLVITFAVRSAGVLLVFVFLVAPAIAAVLIARGWTAQLVIAWVLGGVVTLTALVLSFFLDLPSGPTVVASFGLVLPLVAVFVYLARAADRGRARRQVVTGVVVTTALAALLWIAGTLLGQSPHAHDHSRDPDHHHPHPHPHTTAHAHEGHRHASAPKRQTPVETTPRPGSLRRSAPEAWVAALSRQAKAGTAGWRSDLVQTILDPTFPLLYKGEALELLRKYAGSDFGYGTDPKAKMLLRRWAEGSASSAPSSRPTR